MKKAVAFVLIINLILSSICITAFAAGKPAGLFHDFENNDVFATWILLPNGAGKSNISTSYDKKHTGKASLKLDYDFKLAGEMEMAGFVAKTYSTGIAVSGKPKYVGIWVYGNNSGLSMSLQLFDANKEIEQYATAIKIDWSGWKYLEFEIGKPNTFRGGDNNGVVNYPISFFQAIVSRDTSIPTSKGSIYFDDICFTNEKVTEDIKTDIAENPEKSKELKIPYRYSKDVESNISGIVINNTDFLKMTPSDKETQWNVRLLNDGETDTVDNTSYSSVLHTDQKSQEWAQVELSDIQKLNEVVLIPAKNGVGFPLDFSILVSKDGAAWTETVTKTDYEVNDNTPQKFTFPEVEGKYIKVQAKKLKALNENDYSLKLQEIQIYNDMRINFALDTNGGIATDSKSSGGNESFDYDKIYGDIFASGAKWLLLPQSFINDNANQITVKRNLDYIKANGLEIIYTNEVAKQSALDDVSKTKSLAKSYMQSYLADDKVVAWNGAQGVKQDDLFDENWTPKPLWYTLRNLSNVFVGSFSVDNIIKAECSGAPNLNYKLFSNNRGDIFIPYYNDVDASVSLKLKDTNIKNATIIDPLSGDVKELEFSIKDQDVVFENLAAKDYPLVIKIQTGNGVIASLPFAIRQKLELATVLYVGSSKVYSNGIETLLDSQNNEVKPLIKDEQTLVPIRFISENMGAKVSWSQIAYTATIRYGNKTIKIIPGSRTINVNDNIVNIDVPAQIENGRMYVPLRALVNLLDKQLFWDDRGLIVISNQKYLIDKISDSPYIDTLIESFIKH